MMLGACFALQPEGSGAHLERNMGSIHHRIVRNVIAVAEYQSCAEAARVMAEHRIGSVGVRRGGKLLGIVTNLELVRFLGVFADPRNTPIAAALRGREGVPSQPLGPGGHAPVRAAGLAASTA